MTPLYDSTWTKYLENTESIMKKWISVLLQLADVGRGRVYPEEGPAQEVPDVEKPKTH